MKDDHTTPSLLRCRKPVIILIDTSLSMKLNDRSTLLQAAGEAFLKKLGSDAILSQTVDLLAIKFSSSVLNPETTFQLVGDTDPNIFSFTPSGATDPGKAITFVLEKIEPQKTFYRSAHLQYHEPILYLFTDGIPDAGKGATDEEKKEVEENYETAAKQIRALEAAGKLTFVGVGVGAADENKIRQLTGNSFVCSLAEDDENNLERFFEYVFEGTKNGTPWDAQFDEDLFL